MAIPNAAPHRVHTLGCLRYDGGDEFAELLDDDSMRVRNCHQQILGSHRA
jgi:hypothetical protein